MFYVQIVSAILLYLFPLEITVLIDFLNWYTRQYNEARNGSTAEPAQLYKSYYYYLSSIQIMDGDKFIRIILQFILSETPVNPNERKCN